jgi:hypothetical protein
MPEAATATQPVYRREMPHWGEHYPNQLKRDSLKAALADYILQVNYGGYRPDPRKVLAVKIEDRTTMLHNAGTPLRTEVYYFVEGEVFPQEGTTKLAEGQAPDELAEQLLQQTYEQLIRRILIPL